MNCYSQENYHPFYTGETNTIKVYVVNNLGHKMSCKCEVIRDMYTSILHPSTSPRFLHSKTVFKFLTGAVEKRGETFVLTGCSGKPPQSC